MGTPIVCSRCSTKNGLLQEECRQCGAAISRSEVIRRLRVPGGSPPSAAWETDSIPEIWQRTEPQIGKRENLDAHEFLSYCLLLKSMRRQFDRDDLAYWFDDALFFLRGGYDFFCHLNLTSNMTGRARIFGGLNHGRRPADQLRMWSTRLIDEAIARAARRLDIFVGEEVNSGASAHRIVKVVREHLVRKELRTPNLDLRFHFYLACGDASKFRLADFGRSISRDRRYRVGKLQVTNEFRVFRGPLLCYDVERFSGLKRTSRSYEYIESYLPIRYQAPYFNIECPTTRLSIYSCAPGYNDLDNIVGILMVDLLNADHHKNYEMMERNINESCEECQRLFALLRSTSDGWASQLLFGAPFDDCVRTRAYFLWENQKGERWRDSFLNWLQAEREERRRMG